MKRYNHGIFKYSHDNYIGFIYIEQILYSIRRFTFIWIEPSLCETCEGVTSRNSQL